MADKQIRKAQTKEGDLLSINSENGHLINTTIVQILVERNNPEEVKDLIRAELDYNKERLSILREHAEKHPDAIEERKTRKFRRTQYWFLMGFLTVLLGVICFVPVVIAISLCALAMIIVAGVVLNGRDRDNDSEMLVKILDKIMVNKQ
jgi:hypothetical protein